MGTSSVTKSNSTADNEKFVDNSLIGEQNYSSYLNLLMNKKDILLKKKKRKIIFEEKKETTEKVPTTFEWSDNDNCVYLTGSFCNWNQFFLMQKDEEGKNKLTLNLPKGIHQYKFIINNEWKYNTNFPICNDNGNINNYIDTSNLKIINLNSKNHFHFKRNLSIDNNKNCNLSNKNFIIAFDKYTDYIPLKGEFKKKTPRSPYQYKCRPIINNNKLNKQKRKDETRAKFFPERINHLHYKENSKKAKNQIIKCSVINRYRLKFTKYIYYRSEYK